ncbi:transmembrane protein, putative [Bodo saltans]|uniref:Transmembrane protein, putative n=1 Tax=Bodo saltans TaxID=75058 RepID=A0A0S4J290_BODSA|nr:transmembrane protein, putative [Bodo saltans]|eukprot:CUG61413.1 transmembrane protein, putative [Bodo saltans]
MRLKVKSNDCVQFSSAFVCLRLVSSSYHILPTNRRKFVAENVVLTNVLSTLSPSFSFSASFFVFIFTFLRETPLHFSLVLERCNPAHRRRQHTSDAQLGIHAQPPSLIILFFFHEPSYAPLSAPHCRDL